jgi:hypothetical protein
MRKNTLCRFCAFALIGTVIAQEFSSGMNCEQLAKKLAVEHEFLGHQFSNHWRSQERNNVTAKSSAS